MKVERMKLIARETLRANPDKLFLFGDNWEHSGKGGQAAAMRGEPNAYGIPTKKFPSMDERAFFTDDEFTFTTTRLWASFQGLRQMIKDGGFTTIVIPEAGLGTGRAQLEKRAPKIFARLQQLLAELESL